jgi:hypothetical protein
MSMAGLEVLYDDNVSRRSTIHSIVMESDGSLSKHQNHASAPRLQVQQEDEGVSVSDTATTHAIDPNLPMLARGDGSAGGKSHGALSNASSDMSMPMKRTVEEKLERAFDVPRVEKYHSGEGISYVFFDSLEMKSQYAVCPLTTKNITVGW